PAGCRLGALAGLDDLSTRLSGALSDAASTDAAPPAGGNVFVVSGPGGAGKGTVVERLVADDPRLALSRSWTTRPRRPSESDDAYVFVSDAEFDDHVSAGGFLEWAEFLGHRYGTPNPQPPHGCDLLLEIDVQGAEQIRAENPSAVVVMVLAPSRREQERRMRGRGDPDDVVEARLAKSDDELAAGYAMADLIVVNDDVAQTADDIRALVDRTRNERDRRR
ncbi:MAG TPA: guanylate kinase, partial [Acidimicrobiaceae bacterium]|nr:guanylate kinase [Acidimicrobiaceae bacterium]